MYHPIPPSIDDNAPLDPSQIRGAVDGRDGSTTVAITQAEEAAEHEHHTIGEIVFFQSLIVSQLFTKGMMEDPISLFIQILFCIVAFPLLYLFRLSIHCTLTLIHQSSSGKEIHIGAN